MDLFKLIVGFSYLWTFASLAEDVTEKFSVADGFKLEKIYEVKKAEGSWVGLTEDDKGRLIAADQHGSLYRVTLGNGDGEPSIEKLDIPIHGAHGVLFFKKKLYIVINERNKKIRMDRGVWVTEEIADGWSEPKLLKKINAGGEHGVHSLVPSPDGEWLYLITGNSAKVPEFDDSFPAKVWGEDQLLERNPDGNGHAAKLFAPAGWTARFRPDGSDWQLVAMGQRNTYDAAFHDNGQLFSYDADMEWDFGMPWYRPTRVCHIVPGAEQGWRNGSGKWPAYYEDSISSIVDVGPGSPTGMLAGRGFKAPAKYQQALFILDWTFATIYALHLEPDGATFVAKKEEFIAGAGLPLTDGIIGSDGAMYFATGGRRGKSALWKVTYTGKERTAPSLAKISAHPDRDRLAALTRNPDEKAIDFIFEKLNSDDRTIRFMARAAMERLDPKLWGEKVGQSKSAWQVIIGSIAVARVDHKTYGGEAFDALIGLEWNQLSEQQRLNWLRAVGLIFIRSEGVTASQRESVILKIDSEYPAEVRVINFELARMLCYLNAPDIIGRTLDLMDRTVAEKSADTGSLTARNKEYGKDYEAFIRNRPPTAQIHYLYCLRAVKGPWELSQRNRAFNWLREIENRKGGGSYAKAIAIIRKQIFENGTDAEKKTFAHELVHKPKKAEALPQVKGPGRSWTVADVVSETEGKLAKADRKNGAEMFRASLCSKCHIFDREGGAQGPDLTNLAGRFTVEDLAKSIIHPNEVISDQYGFSEIKTLDGGSTYGRIISEKDEILVIANNPFNYDLQVEISRSDIDSIKPAEFSPMPPALINRLNPDELRDLFAYLLKK